MSKAKHRTLDNKGIPIAERLRPKKISEVLGQEHLTGTGMPLSNMLQSRQLSSTIFWGPPGSGKTTLAKIISDTPGFYSKQLSAIFAGIKDLKEVFHNARERKETNEKTILFVDEIHRFMKSQQDAFLPVIEDGTIILIGATTENPSFELNNALLSRCQVFETKLLSPENLEKLLEKIEHHYESKLPLTSEARELLINFSDGDGRYLLTLAQQVVTQNETLDHKSLTQLLQKKPVSYDKKNDGHYNIISALHKSIRGSDPDAALYWLARMLKGGEDPNYIARRLTRIASEDIGLSDPQALPQCIAAWDAYKRLGSPEGELALAQAVVYLATAPKSVSIYKAFNNAMKTAMKTGSLMPPKHILNAPTKLMKKLDYGSNYIYDPDTPNSFSGQDYFPEEMSTQTFYKPVERGFEREISKRLKYWRNLKNKE